MQIDSIYIAEDQIQFYSPFRVLIMDTSELIRMADARQKEHGEVTYFDDTNPDNDNNGWYNFYIDTDGENVTEMYYENEAGDYIDSIEINESERKALMSKIIEYYGGKEKYESICDKYQKGEW